ncbi:aldo/keto reductase [Neorhodopirellula pilleata]|nr:aldo/keto reductase [Neorhodopirellula pilleata]
MGNEPLFRKEVILGLWPIAGVTTIGVTEKDAITTIETAIECGVTTFDTAYGYGLDGESDRYLGSVLGQDDDPVRFHVIGKVGQRYVDGQRVIDGRPETLRSDAEESLSRIGISKFGTLMLHSVDDQTPIQESARALRDLQMQGLADRIGLCNATAEQRRRFAEVVRCDAIQCPLNLLQTDHLSDVIADAALSGSDVLVYWTLMKGLLAGKIGRDHEFAPGDSRPGYAVFQGDARRRAHDVVDGLIELATELDITVAELSVSWALSQVGVTAALVGARRPDQIRDVAGAKPLSDSILMQMNELIG